MQAGHSQHVSRLLSALGQGPQERVEGEAGLESGLMGWVFQRLLTLQQVPLVPSTASGVLLGRLLAFDLPVALSTGACRHEKWA